MKYLGLLFTLIALASPAHAENPKFSPNVTAGDITRVLEQDEVIRASLKRMRKLVSANPTYNCSGIILNSFVTDTFRNANTEYAQIHVKAMATCTPKVSEDGDAAVPSVEISATVNVDANGKLYLELDTIKFADY